MKQQEAKLNPMLRPLLRILTRRVVRAVCRVRTYLYWGEPGSTLLQRPRFRMHSQTQVITPGCDTKAHDMTVRDKMERDMTVRDKMENDTTARRRPGSFSQSP